MMEKLLEVLTDLGKKQYIPLATRILTLFFFILLLAAFFFGSVNLFAYNFTSRLAMIVVWSLWWPFLYITILFAARIWCGFLCPLSLANEAGNKLRKGKTINYRRWAFLPFMLFFIIVYLEQVSGLFLSTSMTFAFFLLFFLMAFAMGMLFTRFSFCKLVCPIGTLLGVFSRLSFIGLRTRKEICKKCDVKYCILGGKKPPCPMFNNVPSISSNKDCLLCMNCVKNCPYNSAHIGLVKPGKEIEDKAGFTLSESYFIIALFGLALVLTTNGTALARKLLSLVGLELSGALLRAADFIIAIAFFMLAHTVIVYIAAKLAKAGFSKSLTETSYTYLPLIFFIMFYTISFGFLKPWLPLGESAITVSKYIFLSIGMLWSISLIMKSAAAKIRLMQFIFLFTVVLLWAGLVIADPFKIVAADENMITAVQGEKISIDAFSMGYNPSAIIAEKGSEIIISINNRDIVHAFDIDEFDVHEILENGAVAEVRFTPNMTGEFTYYCSIPGHTEAGMKGTLMIVENLDEVGLYGDR